MKIDNKHHAEILLQTEVRVSKPETGPRIDFFTRIFMLLSIAFSKLGRKFSAKKLHDCNQYPGAKTMSTGRAIILSKQDNTPIEITIQEHGNSYGYEEYHAYVNGYSYGHIRLLVAKFNENRELINEKKPLSDHYVYDYGHSCPKNAKVPDKVFVDGLDSNNKLHKGIGTALMQVAIEKSLLNGGEGKVKLEAAWSSHAFYHKLGMKVAHITEEKGQQDDERIANEISKAKDENREVDTSSLGMKTMYMPDDAIAEWTKIIKEKPILEETNTHFNFPDWILV